MPSEATSPPEAANVQIVLGDLFKKIRKASALARSAYVRSLPQHCQSTTDVEGLNIINLDVVDQLEDIVSQFETLQPLLTCMNSMIDNVGKCLQKTAEMNIMLESQLEEYRKISAVRLVAQGLRNAAKILKLKRMEAAPWDDNWKEDSAEISKLSNYPVGRVSIVACKIKNMAAVESISNTRLKYAVRHQIKGILANRLIHYRGYLICCIINAGLFQYAFRSSMDAISFSVDVQEAMLKHQWPEELFKLEHFQTVRSKEDDLIFQGPRLKMGISVGEPTIEEDHLKIRAIYTGQTVAEAKALLKLANQGEILVTQEACERYYTQYTEGRHQKLELAETVRVRLMGAASRMSNLIQKARAEKKEEQVVLKVHFQDKGMCMIVNGESKMVRIAVPKAMQARSKYIASANSTALGLVKIEQAYWSLLATDDYEENSDVDTPPETPRKELKDIQVEGSHVQNLAMSTLIQELESSVKDVNQVLSEMTDDDDGSGKAPTDSEETIIGLEDLSKVETVENQMMQAIHPKGLMTVSTQLGALVKIKIAIMRFLAGQKQLHSSIIQTIAAKNWTGPAGPMKAKWEKFVGSIADAIAYTEECIAGHEACDRQKAGENLEKSREILADIYAMVNHDPVAKERQMEIFSEGYNVPEYLLVPIPEAQVVEELEVFNKEGISIANKASQVGIGLVDMYEGSPDNPYPSSPKMQNRGRSARSETSDQSFSTEQILNDSSPSKPPDPPPFSPIGDRQEEVEIEKYDPIRKDRVDPTACNVSQIPRKDRVDPTAWNVSQIPSVLQTTVPKSSPLNVKPNSKLMSVPSKKSQRSAADSTLPKSGNAAPSYPIASLDPTMLATDPAFASALGSLDTTQWEQMYALHQSLGLDPPPREIRVAVVHEDMATTPRKLSAHSARGRSSPSPKRDKLRPLPDLQSKIAAPASPAQSVRSSIADATGLGSGSGSGSGDDTLLVSGGRQELLLCSPTKRRTKPSTIGISTSTSL